MIDVKRLRELAQAALWTGNWYDAGCNTLMCTYPENSGDLSGESDEIAHPCPLGLVGYMEAAQPKAILALCDRLEAAEKQQQSLTSLLAECRNVAYVEGYAENFLSAAVGSPDDVPAFVGQTVTELRTKLEAAEKDAEKIKQAAHEVLNWTEAKHRPPKAEVVPTGEMALVRVHALVELHAALAQRQGEGS
ncbi:ead/Ea22-like family protein [Burkholderia multivorans]|uniref:ead/Ea22-like family protein n=1 Tax=Burkholderia multivorans TaxID=87883 RepID=UPI0021C00B24|nr:ead/Ea22-like family protein [Burkholderia multivorans]